MNLKIAADTRVRSPQTRYYEPNFAYYEYYIQSPIGAVVHWTEINEDKDKGHTTLHKIHHIRSPEITCQTKQRKHVVYAYKITRR